MAKRLGKQLVANISKPYLAQGRPGANSTGGSDMASRIVAIEQIDWQISEYPEKGTFVRKIWQIQHGLPASSGLLAFTKEFLDDSTNSTEDVYCDIEYDNNGGITIYSNSDWNGICVVASGIQEVVDTGARQLIEQILEQLAQATIGQLNESNALAEAGSNYASLTGGLEECKAKICATEGDISAVKQEQSASDKSLAAVSSDLEAISDFLFGADGISGWVATVNKTLGLKGGAV